MLNLLKPLLGPVVDKIVDRIPNVNDRAQAKEEIEKQLLDVVARADMQQMKINEIEASHKSIFVAGWRPFIGWICGIGILWAFLLRPIAIIITEVFCPDLQLDLNLIETKGLMELVMAMLGMSGLRTYEKFKGVARNASLLKGKK